NRAGHGIVGHDRLGARFRSAIGRGRMSGSFLFVGPLGIGKHTFALKLAQTFLCQTRPEERMDPCGSCPACTQVAANTHPDLLVVARPPDRSFIPLELLIGDKEHRMREGLCHDISLKPYMGNRKVAIVDDADYLNPEGANSLLKTLEEPPPRSVLILVGTTSARQLPTIRSRCRIIRFDPLPSETVAELLIRGGHAGDPAVARRIAQLADGSVGRALRMVDGGLVEFRPRLFAALSRPALESMPLAAAVQSLLEDAGQEAPRRRARFHQVLSAAVDFYRHWLRYTGAGTSSGDPEMDSYVVQAAGTILPDPEAIGACIDHCLETAEWVDRNLLMANLVEFWAGRLAEIYRTGRIPAR
ncbi:MAG: DNA polymerase III subunit, partial [Thermoguttaceae bacterium]